MQAGGVKVSMEIYDVMLERACQDSQFNEQLLKKSYRLEVSFMQMTRVSLGKTAKENSRDMEGVYLTAPKDDPGVHQRRKFPEEELDFFPPFNCCFTCGALGTGKYEIFLFLLSYCQKLFGSTGFCFSALFSWQEELNQ